MPELPEIETIRRGLGPLLVGRRVLGVEVRERRLREPVAPRGLARLRGATVTGIRRRSRTSTPRTRRPTRSGPSPRRDRKSVV